MYVLDQTWLPFANLMLKHIYNVLLICSDYDRFMLEEDGRVEEELYKEYMNLGLSTPPKIRHTNNEEEALTLLSSFSYDLVITMLDFSSEKVEAFASRIKQIKPEMPVVVLSPTPDHRKARMLKGSACPDIDYLFYWQGNSSLFLAMTKLIEDKMNLEHDTKEADVQVIILIEDSVRFISSYLPQMYTSLIVQNRMSIKEALNDWGKTLRMRGRPKIVLARTGEEGMGYYEKYHKNILGIITDVNYPYKGEQDGSGLRLAKEIRERDKDVPILIQSTNKELKGEADALSSAFIWKQSPSLLSDLEDYFLANYNFGPFIFRNPASGEAIATVSTMKDLQNTIKEIPIESFVYHSNRNDFSRWLRAQSLYHLASIIKPIRLMAHQNPEEIRSLLYTTIKNYRANRTRGTIAQFSPANYDETLFFARIGNGSLGGKGRGLAFIAAEMKERGIQAKYPDLYLSIPRTVVLSTEVFDSFHEINNLDKEALAAMDDQSVLSCFLGCKMPEELETDLKSLLAIISNPISVRSSSLLEDSHSEPFAGVYQTCMIRNRGTDDERLAELTAAIKTVWASTYFDNAKEYLKMTEHMLEEEKMAVIIQQITGSEHGDYWYPNVSGVARSLNYYPIDDQKSEDGVGMLSFGFGKAVVDDGSAFRFCPAKPKKPAHSLQGMGCSQDSFYALRMDSPFDPLNNKDNLVLLPLSEAAKYPRALKYIASTLDATTGNLSESSKAEGIKMITFNGMLKYDMFPLASVVDDILKLGAESMGGPVEIEIAVNTERPEEKKPDFSILQIRPIAKGCEDSDVEIDDQEASTALISATEVMGNGRIDHIRDIVSIKPDAFRQEEMIDMAEELAHLNSTIDEGYVLIAAGRLGSTDRWLGIPVSWSDISKAHVIIETGLEKLQVEPSQGTHFFQNVTALGCIYLTINPLYGSGMMRYNDISSLPLVEETKHFIHVRAAEDLCIKANGREKKAIISIHKEKETWD